MVEESTRWVFTQTREVLENLWTLKAFLLQSKKSKNSHEMFQQHVTLWIVTNPGDSGLTTSQGWSSEKVDCS